MIKTYFNVTDQASDQHSDKNIETKNSKQVFLFLLNNMGPNT